MSASVLASSRKPAYILRTDVRPNAAWGYKSDKKINACVQYSKNKLYKILVLLLLFSS
jgi:hypothetical protein